MFFTVILFTVRPHYQYGTVRMIQHVVADRTKNSTSNGTLSTSTHHYNLKYRVQQNICTDVSKKASCLLWKSIPFIFITATTNGTARLYKPRVAFYILNEHDTMKKMMYIFSDKVEASKQLSKVLEIQNIKLAYPIRIWVSKQNHMNMIYHY